MPDYKDHVYNTIWVDGIATWEQFCHYKPDSVKSIATCTEPSVLVHKHDTWNKHRFWLWHCTACDRAGVVREDVLRIWVKQDHKCKCEHRRYEYPHAFKTCPACTRQLPATHNFWYISKVGYLSYRCKRCKKLDNQQHYKANLPIRSGRGVRYDRDMAGGGDINE